MNIIAELDTYFLIIFIYNIYKLLLPNRFNFFNFRNSDINTMLTLKIKL